MRVLFGNLDKKKINNKSLLFITGLLRLLISTELNLTSKIDWGGSQGGKRLNLVNRFTNAILTISPNSLTEVISYHLRDV